MLDLVITEKSWIHVWLRIYIRYTCAYIVPHFFITETSYGIWLRTVWTQVKSGNIEEVVW